jgi:hypothetical protein
VIGAACKPPHAKARHRVPWQLLAHRFAELQDIDFRSTERVVADDAFGLRRVGQHIDGRDAFAAVLLRESMEILIERRDAARNALSIVDGRIERMILKHAAPCGGPGSALP